MGFGIVADVDTAGAQQCERFVQQSVLAGPAIGKNEIERVRRRAPYRRSGILRDYRQPRVRAQMRSGNGLNRWIDINRG
jgi:hypothetical protein